MAATLIGIRQGYPKADFSLTGRKYTVQWIVQCDSYDDGPIVAQAASGLPVAYSSYNFGNDVDTLALLRSWNVNRLEENSLEWVVEATYTTPERKDGAGPGGNTGTGGGTHTDTPGSFDNPLLELPVVKTWSIERDLPVERIYNVNTGRFNPPMNSACEVFNPPAMRKDRYLAISISRNEVLSNVHPALGVAYSGAVNATIFWGLAAGLVQCQSVTAERQSKQLPNGTLFAYLKCEYVFHCRREGWDLLILNAGNYYCPTDQSGSGSSGSSGSGCCPSGVESLNNGEWCLGEDGSYYPGDCGSGSGTGGYSPCRTNCTIKRAFQDEQGHPIKGLLNWNGGRLAQDADPVYMRLRVYPWLNFNVLNLPQSFSGVQ
jgi:hypothetical protein